MSQTTTAAPGSAPRRSFDAGEFFRRYGTLCIFVLLMVGAAWQSDAFLTDRNIMNVLRQIAGTGIMAVGMLFVILTGGIDLSVGSILALGSVASAIVIGLHGTAIGIGAAVTAGAACGLVTGILVAYAGLPPFVITLAAMTAVRGFALIVSNGQPIMMDEDVGAWLTDFGSGFFLGVPDPVILMTVVFVVAGVVLNFTKFGRTVKAIGSNREAVRLSGIPVPRYVMAVYVVSGALAALAGVISTSRTGVGSGVIGVGAELNVIAAVVIGGASLMGGRGGVINTLLGALVMGVIGNIMNLVGVPGYNQQVCMGAIIVIAMLLQHGSRWFRK
ncbi:ABC transporter permease [Acidisoma sp. S159]|uniref:ABC transporter permease n=1 Tax=Acidisoma sp. S159 TaxID=1747225 RepID=UPI00131C2865|nr:ABC transporter permease [Acidisoma sp. S159]